MVQPSHLMFSIGDPLMANLHDPSGLKECKRYFHREKRLRFVVNLAHPLNPIVDATEYGECFLRRFRAYEKPYPSKKPFKLEELISALLAADISELEDLNPEKQLKTYFLDHEHHKFYLQLKLDDDNEFGHWYEVVTTPIEDSVTKRCNEKILLIELIERNKEKLTDLQKDRLIDTVAYDSTMPTVLKREHFDFELQQLIIENGPRSYCFFHFDVDHFKFFNSEYGHDKGNEVLYELGREISHYALRRGGITGRMGQGDEIFALLPYRKDDCTIPEDRLLPEITWEDRCQTVQYDLEMFLKVIHDVRIYAGEDRPRVSCSIGACPFLSRNLGGAETNFKQSYRLTRRMADRALNEAKKTRDSAYVPTRLEVFKWLKVFLRKERQENLARQNDKDGVRSQATLF